MDKLLQADKKLLFKHEVLRSRLDIRDFFLKNAVREVFENIGQVLSVVRMQLAVLDAGDKRTEDEDKTTPGYLVGQSIRDLRAMCKSFYPDADILKDDGFINGLQNILEILFNDVHKSIKIKGVKKEVQADLKLIVFKMMQEILISIKEAEGELSGLTICYKKDEIEFIANYRGKLIALNGATASTDTDELTLHQRAQLINARLQVTTGKAGVTRIKLTSPLKVSFYE